MSCKKLCQYFHEGPGLSFSFKCPQELKKTFKPSALKSGHGLKMSVLNYNYDNFVCIYAQTAITKKIEVETRQKFTIRYKIS